MRQNFVWKKRGNLLCLHHTQSLWHLHHTYLQLWLYVSKNIQRHRKISQTIIFISHIHKIYVSSKLEYDVYLNLRFIIHYWCSMDIKSFLFLVSMRKKCLKLFKYFHHCSTTLLIFIFNESSMMVLTYHIYEFAGIYFSLRVMNILS